MKPYEDFAGYLSARKARSTGVIVALYDGIEAGFDVMTGQGLARWSTVCETHGAICQHRTQETARIFMSSPESWCSRCTYIFYHMKGGHHGAVDVGE